jgi:predicted RNA binding protein YcfA (HicA-like mRNA interferase family)
MKWILERDGWKVASEDGYNWQFEKPGAAEVIILPKLGDAVATEVLEDIVAKAGLGHGGYIRLKQDWNTLQAN